MKLSVRTSPDTAWDSYIEALDGTIYHSAGWAEATRTDRAVTQFFEWRDGCEVAAIAVGHRYDSSIPVLGRVNGTLVVASLPAIRLRDAADATGLLKDLRDYARATGCSKLDIESHMSSNPHVDSEFLAARSRHKRIEFRLDLRRSEDEIWKGLASHHKRKIKRATKQDVSIRMADTARDTRSLRELQKTSHARRRARGEQIHMGDDSPMLRVFENLVDKELADLFFAERDGRVVSAALVTRYRGRVYYAFGGSNEEGFAVDAPGLLFWHMIRTFVQRGFKEFNLGGVPAGAAERTAESYGLYRFKAGFGGRQVECCDYSITVRPLIARAVGAARRLLGL